VEKKTGRSLYLLSELMTHVAQVREKGGYLQKGGERAGGEEERFLQVIVIY